MRERMSVLRIKPHFDGWLPERSLIRPSRLGESLPPIPLLRWILVNEGLPPSSLSSIQTVKLFFFTKLNQLASDCYFEAGRSQPKKSWGPILGEAGRRSERMSILRGMRHERRRFP